ncbi:cell division protein FtsZ [Mycoplasma simbae]|uniref:cell division protein FtsZ n=1 Tax=Mycoplasma simbae TaxID=36744 RepID=UPI00068FAD3F|nr:cell division protein FtsZ [Mycoplasma simbae]
MQSNQQIKIKVIGVGGAGNNIVGSLANKNIANLDLIVANTDFQILQQSEVENKLYLGTSTNGLGAGGDPKIGAQCAQESIEQIEGAILDAQVLILIAGLGKGTGTGASPIIAQKAKEKGILTLALLTTPMQELEGSRASEIASIGLRQIKECVNSYMVISNAALMQQGKEFPFAQALRLADENVANALSIISEIINQPTLMNLDFNDFKNILQNGGKIIMASAKASGENKVKLALDLALNSCSILEQPQHYEHLIFHYLLDKYTSYADVLSLKNSVLEHFNMDATIDTKLGIGSYNSKDPKSECFKFSFIATEQGGDSVDDEVQQNQNEQNITQEQKDIDELTKGIDIFGSEGEFFSDIDLINRDKIPNF